jgi:hypothetical protein
MTILPRARAWVLAFALGVSALAVAPTAHAGTLRVVDEAHQLAPSQLQELSGVVARAPFDGRLVVTTEYADAQDLARYVHTLVSSPSLVVVGLDPQHRHVQVRFGVESGVPRAQWADIERAGNDAFRRGDWAGGASAIFETAARSAAASPLAKQDEPSRQLAPAERPSMFGTTFLVLAVLGVVVAGLYFLSRRRDGRGGYPGAYGPPSGYGPGPTGYGPGGGYAPPAGGMGPLGGGLIGAGLGGLAGYELGKAAGEREERDHEDRDYDRSTERDGGGGGGNGDDYDAGGGGSSWDDGGGSDRGGSDGGGSDGGGSDGGGSDF